MPLRGRVGRHTRQGGRQAQNWPDDQLTIINLLNNIAPADGGAGASLSKSVRSGICSDELYRAISTFEDKQFPRQRDGYVDPGGAMLKRMETLTAKTAAPIRFVTPDEWLGPPTGKTRDISNTEIPLSSIDVVWVGLTGDSQNIIKTVAANIPGAVTIAEANTANNIRWFRLTKLPGHGTETQVQAKDGAGKVVVSFDLSLIELAKGPGTLDTELGSDRTIVYLAPKARADYIDNRAEGVGYYIYHPSFQVYCSGMTGPIYVSDDFLKLDVEKAEAINSTIYGTLAEAKDAIRRAPAKTKGVTPFAYFKGAGGAVIAPTIFSPATTPRIIVGYYGARRVWAQNVASELTCVAIGVGTGTAFRMTLGRIYRPLPEDPEPPSYRPPPIHEPPALTRLRNTVVDMQNKNPLRTGEVLSSPRTYRHTLTGGGFAPSSYARIEMEGSMRLSTGGADAQYGEGVYAWPAGFQTTQPYIDIEVPPGTGVETLDFGGSRWVRMVPPAGDRLPVKIVGTNMPQAQIEMGRKLVSGH